MTEAFPEPLDVGGGRRLTLTPDGIALEVRQSVSTWSPLRTIPYDEIRCVYRYQARDWAYLAVALVYWIAGTVAAAIPAATGLLGVTAGVTLLLAPTLLVGTLAAVRILTRPVTMLRIETLSEALVLPLRRAEFFEALGERLARAAAPA